MKRPSAGLVAAVAALFLVGCMGVQARPLPEPSARVEEGIRGVILADAGDRESERVEPRRVEEVAWTDSTIVITGVFEDGGPDAGGIETRAYRLSSLSGILVRAVDVNRTSAVIGLAVVVAVATIALIINGQGGQGPLR